MSNNILTNNTITPPPTIDTEEIAKRISNQAIQMAKEMYNSMVRVQRRGIEIVWENPKVSPQDVFNALGDKGEKVCQFHAALTQFVATLAQMEGVHVDLKFPTHQMEVSDGVVTVTDEPYTI
jgi:hypothetical protein